MKRIYLLTVTTMIISLSAMGQDTKVPHGYTYGTRL